MDNFYLLMNRTIDVSSVNCAQQSSSVQLKKFTENKYVSKQRKAVSTKERKLITVTGNFLKFLENSENDLYTI